MKDHFSFSSLPSSIKSAFYNYYFTQTSDFFSQLTSNVNIHLLPLRCGKNHTIRLAKTSSPATRIKNSISAMCRFHLPSLIPIDHLGQHLSSLWTANQLVYFFLNGKKVQRVNTHSDMSVQQLHWHRRSTSFLLDAQVPAPSWS